MKNFVLSSLIIMMAASASLVATHLTQNITHEIPVIAKPSLTGYEKIEDWICEMGYKPEEVYFGSTKYTLEKNLSLMDFIDKYHQMYKFPEEEAIHQDEEMKELSSNFGKWCFCCKRTCLTCSKKNM